MVFPKRSYRDMCAFVRVIVRNGKGDGMCKDLLGAIYISGLFQFGA